MSNHNTLFVIKPRIFDDFGTDKQWDRENELVLTWEERLAYSNVLQRFGCLFDFREESFDAVQHLAAMKRGLAEKPKELKKQKKAAAPVVCKGFTTQAEPHGQAPSRHLSKLETDVCNKASMFLERYPRKTFVITKRMA